MSKNDDKKSIPARESKQVPTFDHAIKWTPGKQINENHKSDRSIAVKNTMPAPTNPNGGGKDKK